MMQVHGGNLREISQRYDIDEDAIIDFSSSINPLGSPSGVRLLLRKGACTPVLIPRYSLQRTQGSAGIITDGARRGTSSPATVPRSLYTSYPGLLSPAGHWSLRPPFLTMKGVCGRRDVRYKRFP